MGETLARHLLGQGLDQIDVPSRDDGFDALDDRVVVESPADIVFEGDGCGLELDIDGEAHALGDALLVGVDADLDVEHEVVDEDAVEALRRVRGALGLRALQSLFRHRQRLRCDANPRYS